MKPPCVFGEKMNFDCTKLTTKHDVNWMWTVQVKSSTKKVIFFSFKEMIIFLGLVILDYFRAEIYLFMVIMQNIDLLSYLSL